MASLTSRYSSSPETVMEQDLNRLRVVKDGDGFIELLNHIIGDTLTDDFWNIPHCQTTWPRRQLAARLCSPTKPP